MFDEELEKKNQPMGPRNLDNMSIYELKEYIDELKEEITKVETAIKKKEESHEAASSVFK
jgi:uncharacterized small protein (DUF1192 family)